MKITFIVLFMSLIALTSCDNKDKNKEDDKQEVGKTDCLVGEWYFEEGGFKKTFTFNNDKTGVEVQAADDVRNFTWSIKNDQPIIVYVNETNEWAFNLDCEKNQLTIFMAVYKK
jgi:hypothetical protein